jgi:Fe-S-cluster containining protein
LAGEFSSATSILVERKAASGFLKVTWREKLTDLVQIRLQGEKKRDENLRFRRHMKSHDYSDRILRRIAEEIQDQIDCTACANCCRVATAVIQERDVERLARYLRIPPARFLAEYSMEGEEGETILRRSDEKGCVFLDGNECTVYDARPDTCRHFPHMVRGAGSIASRMWQFVDRATYCPIVYNSLEAFKTELKFKR